MTSSVTMVQGDTAPSVFGALTDSDGQPIDLTGCTVRFQMRQTIDRRFVVNAVAVLTNASTGMVRYDWQDGDLAVAGDYEVRWQIIFPDSSIEHTDPADSITVAAQ